MRRSSLVVGFTLLIATAAYSAPTPNTTPGKIQNSKHDMNMTIPGTGPKGEICIYCHTPHNAVIPQPLWNRNNPCWGLVTLYNSPTLTTAAKGSMFSHQSISLFCMSCHDGVTGVGDVANKNVVVSNQYGIEASTGAAGANTPIPTRTTENASFGKNLSKTHPVAFDFTSVPTADTGIRSKIDIEGLFLAGQRTGATTAQGFLYGDNGNMFECASCHRVHDPGTSGNFLRIENDRSQLCLACHNK